MKAETVPLGEQILERYATLEQSFRDGTVTAESLQQQTGELGRLEGALRAAHLKYHLLTKPLLTGEQVAAYDRLRGYAGTSAPGGTEPSAPPSQQTPATHEAHGN
jgi:hypothetical protein